MRQYGRPHKRLFFTFFHRWPTDTTFCTLISIGQMYCSNIDKEVDKAIQLKDEYMVEKKIRKGWAEAFIKYAEEGEDEMLLPDSVDNDGETEL